MLRFCIVAAGTIFLAAAGSATAQTATEPAPGKPIPLLQILEKPAPAKSHVKTAAKPHKKFAARHHTTGKHATAAADASAPAPAPSPAPPAPAPTGTEAASDSIWPAVNASSLANAGTGAPTPDAAPASSDPPVGALVVDGQTVKIASPDEVNELDLAADNATATPDAALKNDFAQVATPNHAAVGAPAKKPANAVGSATWVAQVLAALGGAIAAGSAAWFLIGSTPQRTYT